MLKRRDKKNNIVITELKLGSNALSNLITRNLQINAKIGTIITVCTCEKKA